MKNLYTYIIESRGVVTGENSWSKTVNYLLKGNKFVDDPKHLAPWINSVTVIDYKNEGGMGGASYRDDLSKIVDSKMDVVIAGMLEKSTLEHELQHAFDDWVARVKKNKDSFFSDHYCLATGFECDEPVVLDILNDPSSVTCDHIFELLKQCTYFFEKTEVNAYVREFSLYLQDHSEFDFEKSFQDPSIGNPSGIFPIFWLDLLYKTMQSVDLFIEDGDHVDWEYIKKALHHHWSKQYLGKNVVGKDDKDTFIKTCDYIIKKRADYLINQFKRVMKDYDGVLKNIPEFLR